MCVCGLCNLLIYLAMLGLSCGMGGPPCIKQDLCRGRMDSLVAVWTLLLHGIRDLSSPTKDQTLVIEFLTHRATRKSLMCGF